jgi:Protein of unknown function (DUF4058)
MLSLQEDRTMPSPFPGMNPFLENPDVWSTFHIQMLAAMADRLSAQVRPDYLVHGDGQSRQSAACSRLLADRASTALGHNSGAATAS